MLNFHLPFSSYLTVAKLIPLWKRTKLWSFSVLLVVKQRVLTPSCKYLFFWIKDNLKIKRVLAISFVCLRSQTRLVTKLLVLFVITTITMVRKKMKLFPCFSAIKTLLWRVKRKEKRRLFNWIALNSSLETYENIVQKFFPFNSGTITFGTQLLVSLFWWWQPPFFVSALFRF